MHGQHAPRSLGAGVALIYTKTGVSRRSKGVKKVQVLKYEHVWSSDVVNGLNLMRIGD